MRYILKEKKGQSALGYVELFVTDNQIKGKRSAAIVHYMAANLKERPFPRIAVTLLTEQTKNEITDGMFHEFYDELIDQQIKPNSRKYFEDPSKINYLDTITMHIGNIDDISIMANGGYGILD